MNDDIRKLAKENKVYLWRIAEIIGMSDSQFSRMLRYELKAEMKKKIINSIYIIANLEDANNDTN